MPQTIKIMTWNIQNLGPTKSGIKYDNYDVIAAIAKKVVDADVDLLIVLEINTVHTATARQVMSILGEAMSTEATRVGRPAGSYSYSILSRNTGLEFYGFIIKDITALKPTRTEHPQPAYLGGGTNYDPGWIGKGSVFSPGLNDCTFRTIVPAALGMGVSHVVLNETIPLFEPNLRPVAPRAGMRPRPIPVWPGNRLGCLAVFEAINAGGANRFLPIFACHFDPNHDSAKAQIDLFPYFELFHELRAGGAPIDINVEPAAGGGAVAHTTNMALVTGDFNIDRNNPNPAGGYNGLTGMGYAHQIPGRTHLVTASNYSDRDYHSTPELAISGYDNFFIDPSSLAAAGPCTINNAAVYDIPGAIRTRALTLNASIRHYAELDQRGFVGSQAYLSTVVDFVKQLRGNALINYRAALIGGRLISDHLPVSIDLTIA